MLYLLDANVLIDANRDYYPLGRVPEFWDWLVDCGVRHRMRIPLETYEEVLVGKDDDLARWLKDNRDALLLNEDADPVLVARVVKTGYAPDLNDEESVRTVTYPTSAGISRCIAATLSNSSRR